MAMMAGKFVIEDLDWIAQNCKAVCKRELISKVLT